MDDWTLSAAATIKALRLEHPRYVLARKRLERALILANPGEVIALCGPSRVGKTSCIKDVAGALFGTREPDDAQMPFVYVEVANESRGAFLTTKAFTGECLRVMRHPHYGSPELSSVSPEAFDEFVHRTPEATLKSAFERSLTAKRTQLLVFDEAQHVKYLEGGDYAAARILDSWKCLASKAQIKLVLAGSFELLNYIGMSAHLLGRLELISFDRYNLDDVDDVRAWEQILLTLSKYLRFASTKESLRDWNDLLYEGSLGCLGLLLKWIRRALVRMDPERDRFLTREQMLASAFSKTGLGRIAEEIRQGEAAMQAWESPATKKADVPVRATCKPARKPFRRISKRIPLGGRA